MIGHRQWQMFSFWTFQDPQAKPHEQPVAIIPGGQEASVPEALILVQERLLVIAEGGRTRLRASLSFFMTESKVSSIFPGTIS